MTAQQVLLGLDHDVATVQPTRAKFYLATAALALASVALPALAHAVPDGGRIFLPLYACTVVGVFGFGWMVGALVGAIAPLLNFALFGMPAAMMLPGIYAKTLILLVAGLVLVRATKGSGIVQILLAVAAMVGGGWVFDALWTSVPFANNNLATGIPGVFVISLIAWVTVRIVAGREGGAR